MDNSRKRLILAVDDNQAILEIIKKTLQDHFELSLASSGAEALEILNICKPDLILLDVDMPKISGFDLIKQIKNNSKVADIPVIFISGADGFEDELMGLNLGGVDYVTKPITPELLRRRCELHLELSSQTDISFARMILDNAPFACNLWSMDKRTLVYANNAVVSMFKLVDKSTWLYNLYDYLPKYQPDGEVSIEAIHEKLDEAGKLGSADFAWTYNDGEGDAVPTWVSLRRIYIKNDAYVIGYIRDLRRESEIKRVLRDERDRLQELMDMSPVNFVLINTDKIIYTSKSAAQTFAGKPGDALSSLFQHKTNIEELFAHLQKDGFAHNLVCPLQVRGGAFRRFNIEAKCTDFDAKPAFVLWLTDVEDICS